MAEPNEIVLPDSPDIPEKFRGKTVQEALKSYEEAQKEMHQKAEETAKLKREKEALEQKLQNPEPNEPEPIPGIGDEDEFATMSKKEFVAYKKQQEAELNKKLEENRMVMEKRLERKTFIDNHPEMFKGKTEEQASQIIATIAAQAYLSDKQTLEGGFQALQEINKTMGIATPAQNVPVPVPNSSLDRGAARVGVYDSIDEEVQHMVEYAQKGSGKISGFLKK